MILGPSYKFPSAISAFEKMKRMTKREVIRFEDIIPPTAKELKDKAVYMQESSFWEDKHNAKMFEYGNELGEHIANGGNKVREFICKNSIKNLITDIMLERLFKRVNK